MLLALGLSAQHRVSRGDLKKIPVLQLPAQDNAALLAKEMSARRKGRPNNFAVNLPVQIRAQSAGRWRDEGSISYWRLLVSSPGAKSLNLGFAEYILPEGAALYLSTDNDRYGPFTAADNELHKQLWTPILAGDELLIELEVPTDKRDEVQLYLTDVNHDYVDVQKSISQSCNLDVACGAENGFGIVDRYRDVIRSVAVYSIGGRSICTGVLVNNTNQDGRPLFLTADHCGVFPSLAPTVVAYWNYENSNCRPPNSAASGSAGNGLRNIANSGAIYRAGFEPSDFTLLEFDDPVNPRANAFFAGWSALDAPPTDTLISVHHPNTEEKRISFSFRDAIRTNGGNGFPVADGRLFYVPQWDIGTTERGSSGAPLFDRDHRVRGQLFGGAAQCGNQEYDLYGTLATSWTGGGTPDTRLSDYFDPCGTGALVSDGLEQEKLPLLITADENCQSICTDGSATFALTLGNAFSVATPIAVTAPDVLGVTAPSMASGGSTISVAFQGTGDTPSGDYQIEVAAGTGDRRDVTTLHLTLVGDVARAPAPLSPAQAAMAIDPTAGLSWQPVADAESYGLQVSTRADFSSLITGSEGLTVPNFEFNQPLEGDTRYYWRVRSLNECGQGAWSTVYNFTTANIACGEASGNNLPVDIPFSDATTVAATLQVNNSITISSLEVQIGIVHSYIGDIRGELVAPSGRTARLFLNKDNGNCAAENLYVIFSDEATEGSLAFERDCTAGSSENYQFFQPLDAFSAFVGEEARGQWQLLISDDANLDGGEITDFSLLFCAAGDGGGRDLSVAAVTPSILTCSNEGAQASLHLGADYAAAPFLRIEAGGLTLDNYTFDYRAEDNRIEVNFSSWSLLEPSNYDLKFVVVADDNSEREVSIPLTVLPIPTLVEPVAPQDDITVDSGLVDFTWPLSSTATSYTLEFSPTENFSEIVRSEPTVGESLEVLVEELPNPVFWRVVASNECGEAPSAGRLLRVDTATTSLSDFGADLSVAVFPNPTKGRVTVSLSGNWPTVRLSVHDASGRRVDHFDRLVSGRNELALEQLPAGMYYLRFTTPGRGAVYTQRLVVVP